MAEQQVTLNPGESKVVAFQAVPTEAKVYSVTVNGLTGTFTAVPPIEVSRITFNKEIFAAVFTIAITFSNPTDYDVYVRPKFAFGKADTIFIAEKVLRGWDYYEETYSSGTIDWVKLGHPQHPGSNMTFAYDPDGIMVNMLGGGSTEFWLKVPAKSSATTERQWYVASEYSVSDVRDICVMVENPFYLVYDPGWGTRIIGGTTIVLNWRPVALDPFSGVALGIVTPPKEAVTIDRAQVRLDYETSQILASILATNHTNLTLIDQRGVFDIGIHGNFFWPDQKPGPGLQFKQSNAHNIGNFPPGSREIALYDYSVWHRGKNFPIWEGQRCYLRINFWYVDERPTPNVHLIDTYTWFEGYFGRDWTTWNRVPQPFEVIEPPSPA